MNFFNRNPHALILCAMLFVFSGCETWRKKPPVVAPTPVPTNPVEAAHSDTTTATKYFDEITKRVEAAALLFKQKLAANIDVALDANLGNPEGFPKTIVSGELRVARARIDAESDPVELAAGQKRRADVEAGRAEDARKAYDAAVIDAKKLVDENIKLKVQVALASDALVKAREAEAKALADYQARLEKNRVENQAKVDALVAAHNKEMEEERSKAARRISNGLYGLGSVLLIAALAIGAFSVKSGDPFNGIIRALIILGGAGFCFAMAWTFNQPWFKYLVIGGASLGAIAVFAYLFAEWREAMKKKEAAQRAKEADEAETTLKKVMTVIDAKPKTDPIFDQLTKKLDESTDKALIHELKAEDQRLKAPSAV